MPGCIYARTSRIEKAHDTARIEHQVQFCRELAARRNVHIDPAHVFTDIELTGDLPPSCWAADDAPGRPALAAMIEAIEEGRVKHVLVHRPDVLGTSSDVLLMLKEFFSAYGVSLIADRAMIPANDAAAGFAFNILKPLTVFDTEWEREKKRQARARIADEIARLHNRIARLETELAELE